MPSASTGIGIELQAVGKRFGDGPEVLERISLHAAPGSFTSLIGPSGCGKSTLLRLIAGLLRPSTGEILFDGATAEEPPETAFIFQDATLLPWLTTLRNIETPLRLRGRAMAERAAIARERARLVGLEHALELYPRQLSGGMRMRASLARALTLSPRLLLLDEPFGALDAMTRNRLNEELLALHRREGWTAFFVTHSVSEAVFLSDRVVILGTHPGRIEAIVQIDLPRVRDSALREDLAYQRAVAEATARLHRVLPAPVS